jgi:hypothetical protein
MNDEATRQRCRAESDEILMAAMLLNRFEPMTPHHIAAVRERLRYLNDYGLIELLRTGKWPNTVRPQETKENEHE